MMYQACHSAPHSGEPCGFILCAVMSQLYYVGYCWLFVGLIKLISYFRNTRQGSSPSCKPLIMNFAKRACACKKGSMIFIPPWVIGNMVLFYIILSLPCHLPSLTIGNLAPFFLLSLEICGRCLLMRLSTIVRLKSPGLILEFCRLGIIF